LTGGIPKAAVNCKLTANSSALFFQQIKKKTMPISSRGFLAPESSIIQPM